MKRVAGSIKNKIVATELVEERKRLDFNQDEVRRVIGGDENNAFETLDLALKIMNEHPAIRNKPEFHEMTV